ncbi:MAG: protein kinase [Bryobacteraceae bacterium]
MSPSDPNEEVRPTVTFSMETPVTVPHPTEWAHFKDLRLIGGGGFGNVYRAWDTELQRDVALKLLSRAEESAPDAIQEARMMARVRHPNIVPVYGVASAGGRVGFWSELIEGPSLASLVKSSGPMKPRAAASAVAQLCKAVAALHAAGILHRDIKAENALQEPGGRVLLTDFGLSRDPSAQIFGGTLPYMAPELLAGRLASPASDIYALGVLLYFLVSTAFPVLGTIDELRSTLAAGETEPLSKRCPTLPKALLDIVSRATAFQPEARFATVEGMLVPVEAYLASSEKASSPRRKWVLAIAAVILAVVAGVWFAVGRRQSTGGAYPLYQQGRALLERRDKPGNVDTAIGLLTRAIASDPKFALAHADLADALWEKFRQDRDPATRDRAVAEADRALELDRELAPVFLVEGRIHEGTGKRNLAIEDLSRALKLDSSNADVYRELGQIYNAQGRDADADAAFQKAIDLDPNNWWNYNARGGWLFNKGHIDEAAVLFEKELALTPDNLWGISNLSLARMRQGRLADARLLLERSLALSPNDFTAHTSLGFLLMQLGEYDAAATQFNATAKLNPADYASWGNLASAIEYGSGGIEKARPAYFKAIEFAEVARRQNPSDAYLAASLGGYHAAVGAREQALTLIRQAIALAPTDANVLVAAGEGYEILGMRDKAIPLIMESLRRGYPADIVRRSPDLAQLRNDKRFGWPVPKEKKK